MSDQTKGRKAGFRVRSMRPLRCLQDIFITLVLVLAKLNLTLIRDVCYPSYQHLVKEG